jgi:hypothetical protein
MQEGPQETRRQNRRQSNCRKGSCARTCTKSDKKIGGGLTGKRQNNAETLLKKKNQGQGT